MMQAQARLPGVGALLYAAWAAVTFVVVVLGFFVLAAPGTAQRARRLAKRAAGLLFRLWGIPLSAQGLERLPSSPHILLINHTSFLDALALTAILPAEPGYTFTTRQEFRSQSLLCPLINSVHTLVLRPSGRKPGINIELMKRALRRHENLAIFPEGRFTTEPGLRSFHSGAFVAAVSAKVPVVVAGLRGARAGLPLGSWRLRRTAIALEVGPMFEASRHDANASRRMSRAARAAMLDLCGEHDACSAQ